MEFLEPDGSAVNVGRIYQSDDKKSHKIALRASKKQSQQAGVLNVPADFYLKVFLITAIIMEKLLFLCSNFSVIKN